MGSLIPGYKYDIFISYRQNDNKYDGWVTEFVANLIKELEATIKDKVTVYFDANPHDGLLETHSVDRSLEEKLRCLIFIPILSRTYCDVKSYAWNNEFLTFLNIAREDNIGLNVKLSSGNVASRVLPIRIHDLNPEDINLVESQIGVIRGIDFIYKEPGVNRSLTANDDKDLSQGRPKYRNQINKVANAIDEIIHCLKVKEPSTPDKKASVVKQDSTNTSGRTTDEKASLHSAKKARRWLIISLSILLCIVGAFVIYKVVCGGNQVGDISDIEKSIAVLPFVNDSPDKDNEYFCNGMMEEILTQLQNIHDLKVKSRTSVEKYRDTEMDIKDIGRELGVYMIMEGSVRKIEDNLRISVQLINTKTGDHLWAENYDGKYTTEIFDFQSNLAKKVATSLNSLITPEEEKRIDVIPTTQMVAHDLDLKAREIMNGWYYSRDSLDLKHIINLVNQALKIDPIYINALNTKATIYSHSGIYDSALYYYNKILELDPENALSFHGIAGVWFLKRLMPDSALFYCFKVDKLLPNYYWNNLTIGQIFTYQKNDILTGLPYYQKSIVSGGSSEHVINYEIAYVYNSIDYYSKDEKYLINAIFIKPQYSFIKNYGLTLLIQGKYNECFHFLDSIASITRCEQVCDMVRFRIYVTQKEFQKAEKYYNLSVTKGYTPTRDDDLYLAYIYKETGKEKEALIILNKIINFTEKRITASDSWGISISNTRLAAAYALLNEDAKALKCLSEVERAGPCERYISIKTFPGFDKLRNNPEFQSILKRIEDKKATLRAQVKEMELRGEINL